MLNLGHPWVIADRYTSRWPKMESGSLAELEDFLGIPIKFQVEALFTQEQYDVVIV